VSKNLNDKELLLKEVQIKRQLLIIEARRSFWTFCKVLAPDFYTEDKEYLKEYCNVLQALYEGRIVKNSISDDWVIVNSTDDAKTYNITCYKLMINMPPQHGKSRTLVYFCQWVLGQNQSERIITVSYNEDTAIDFSKYTRDGISEEKLDKLEIIYSDIFPNVEIKKGSSSNFKWALKGQHFSYLGTGIGGSVTSKSGTVRIIDDPIKSAEEALNENNLNKIWQYYTGTFLSRVSGKHIDIINHTRWADKDLCGRLLALQPEQWYVFKKEVYDKETDLMLCDELLSKSDYLDLKQLMIPEIFYANYHQKTIDEQNKLYSELKLHEDIPTDLEGNCLFESIVSFTDTADTGDDYLASIVAGVYQGKLYILDILYTQKPMEVTEPLVANMLYRHKVNLAYFESNNGGKGFARKIKDILNSQYNYNYTVIKWFMQRKNKQTRILLNAPYIMENVYFPVDSKIRFAEAWEHLNTFSRKGKNKHDDIEDALTALVEHFGSGKKQREKYYSGKGGRFKRR
jgi:predicted phage terminase large subunit-like protein